MSIGIEGIGWVTPLGNDLDEVWRRLVAGERGEVKPITDPQGEHLHHYVPVPPKQVEAVGRMPRLRRSSAISYFTATAALAAWKDAGLAPSGEEAGETAIIFAVSDGGVIYSRRFYDAIVNQGANAASPLLFPETVYNAPASHVAALLGCDGATYTVVGDASAGISALLLARDLIEAGEVERCLVVGGEEVDWVLCEACRRWRLTTRAGTFEVYQRPAKGTLLGEGAAAFVLGRNGAVELERIHAGLPFVSRRELKRVAKQVYAELRDDAGLDLVIGCANGSFLDSIEEEALAETCPGTPVSTPKCAFGEAVGASALLQTAVGALALKKQQLPPVHRGQPGTVSLRRVLVPVLGWNEQASGVVLGVR